jgi:hypothetical protein
LLRACRFEDPWKQKVYCWIKDGRFYVCPAGPDKKPTNVAEKDAYDLLDWVVVPDKDGKFMISSDTTSSNDSLKLKADTQNAGMQWIEAINEAKREATRRLEENRTAALERERQKVEHERQARKEAEAAAKNAEKKLGEEQARKSLEQQPDTNVEDSKKYQHAQKMVAKLTEEVSSHKERLKNLEERVSRIVDAPSSSPSRLSLEELVGSST